MAYDNIYCILSDIEQSSLAFQSLAFYGNASVAALSLRVTINNHKFCNSDRPKDRQSQTIQHGVQRRRYKVSFPILNVFIFRSGIDTGFKRLKVWI
jgi:hypothetical protein